MHFEVEGGVRLCGELRPSRAKNAALPLLAASLLTEEELGLWRLPRILDVQNMLQLLRCLGVHVQAEEDGARLRALSPHLRGDSYPFVRAMRASVLVLGPLLARLGEARLALPGGCPIGSRPIDLHLKGLTAMGAKIHLEDGEVRALAPQGLTGARIVLDTPSVGATENLLMAATLAKGETLLVNAAREPEIGNLAQLLNRMGATVRGAGESVVRVEGKPRLHGAQWEPIPDRIEAGTLLLMAAATGGELYLRDLTPEHLGAVEQKLLECGARIERDGEGLRVRGGRLVQADVCTQAYPGFPTDLQAPMMALLCRASGSSILVETIFENRFQHAAELRRMGAQITVRGQAAVVRGVRRLYGTRVEAGDLRAGAALILAGLCADGCTEVAGVEHVDRGYEGLDEKLRSLGARIRRVED